MRISFCLFVFFLVFAPAGSAGEISGPVRHELRFPQAAAHYVEVRSSFPAADHETLTVFMATWTPGSYLIREYARHVEEVGFTSPDGELLHWEKVAKNRWKVWTGGHAQVLMQYRVFAHDMSVRNNFVGTDYAFLVGAGTYMTPVDGLDLPHEVRLHLPARWPGSATGLEAVAGSPHTYRARNYTELVDSPIVAGKLARYPFTVRGKPHELVNVLEDRFWDGEKAAADLRRLVEEHAAFWGGLPYENYRFLNLITGSGGGLEHLDSTVLMTDRWATRTRENYIDWLDLASHEFFHVWNVKRLRPRALGPFDYERENYTRSLWIAEGFTSYYSALLNLRAGLITRDEYLERLADELLDLKTTPARKVQSVAEASFDAWIKYYRRDENSANTDISYYGKGEVIAFLLDARIRAATGGSQSLDTLMRSAYARFSGTEGYTPEQFIALTGELAGTEVADWLKAASTQSGSLDLQPALAYYGLRLDRHPGDSGGKGTDEAPAAWLGAEFAVQEGRLVARTVTRGTPAYLAGLSAGDELVAIDDVRVLPGELEKRMQYYAPADRVKLTLARRGALRELAVELAARPAEEWRLTVVEKPTPEQRKHLAAWLGRQ